MIGILLLAAQTALGPESVLIGDRQVYPVAKGPHGAYFSVGKPMGVDAVRMEWFLSGLEEKLGVKLDCQLHYLRISNTKLLEEAGAPHGSDGATWVSQCLIGSGHDRYEHELVHLLVSRAFGEPEDFWSEGLAITLGEGTVDQAKAIKRSHKLFGDTSPWGSMSLDSHNGISFAKNRWSWYIVAGGVTSWLIQSDGLPKFLEFYKKAGTMDTYQAFDQVYGGDMDDMYVQWLKHLPARHDSP